MSQTEFNDEWSSGPLDGCLERAVTGDSDEAFLLGPKIILLAQ